MHKFYSAQKIKAAFYLRNLIAMHSSVEKALLTTLLVLVLSSCDSGGPMKYIKKLQKFRQDHPGVSLLIFTDINQREEKVPAYELPPLLRSVDDEAITSAAQWQSNREDLIALFADHIYGHTPKEQIPVHARVIESDQTALNGKALRQQVELDFLGHKITLLIYRPNNTTGPVPAFLALNFRGNHTVNENPAILLTEHWVPKDEDHGVFSNQATEANRGQRARRWPLEMIIDRGYAFVTAYYGDFYPDHGSGQINSVHRLFNNKAVHTEWGAIGAWSWGMSRILDYLNEDNNIDASQVIAIGHSRLGKAALWAAAQDQRFAAAISNDSGAGGAALSRRQFGESVKLVTALFPYWFNAKFKDYAEQENHLPLDQHQLIALLAPRPVYVASASEDLWADPRGEFLAAGAATEVYQLFGMATNKFSSMPLAGEALTGPVSYHLRAGKHDLLEFDWKHYLKFADCYLIETPSCQQQP